MLRGPPLRYAHAIAKRSMGKRKLGPIPEHLLPLRDVVPPSTLPIVDTHCHLLSTFCAYREKYPEGRFESVGDFVKGLYADGEGEGGPRTEKVVDVWCEAPVLRGPWEDMVKSADEGWGGVDYRFVIGVHPHHASDYDDAAEAFIERALSHKRNVGLGEVGLDYHYDSSPRPVQQAVFRRQLRLARRLGKPVTVHTREADDDCFAILTEELPREAKLHVHCFTDALPFAIKLLGHFPNLRIGVTGVVTFSTNENTRSVIDWMVRTSPDEPLRILLETDSPYMTPTTLPLSELGLKSGQRMPFSHSGVIPWTADFVARIARQAGGDWDADRVMRDSRQGASMVYGI